MSYILIRVPRRWVPDWLWRISPAVVRRRLLSEHRVAECGCPCHVTPGMRDCAFCR